MSNQIIYRAVEHLDGQPRSQERGSRRRFLAPALAAAAIAATLGPLASPAAAFHSSIERRSGTSVWDSNNKPATARCPTGKSVIGTGAEITGGTGDVVIDEVVPNAELTEVTVWAYEDHSGFTGSWSVTAYAICSSGFTGLKREQGTTSSSSISPKTASSVACATGKRLLGTGYQIFGASGQVTPEYVLPNAALTSVSVQAYEGHSGTSASWILRAYGICGTPPSGWNPSRVVGASSTSNPDDPKPAPLVACTGRVLTGAGAVISNGQGHIVLDDLRPNLSPDGSQPPTSVKATGYAEDHGYLNNWSIKAYAICI